MTSRILILAFLTATLSGCITTHASTDSLAALAALNTKSPGVNAVDINSFRIQALQDTALTVGAQAGLYSRSIAINQMLMDESTTLDRIYNFNGLLLPHSVLPPVLGEGRDTLNLADPNTIRIADRTYAIISQAKFVTTAPNWRDYLWMNYQKAPIPDKSLLPSTSDEKKAWKKAIKMGWQNGIDQANVIFSENNSRLTRDYNGMLLYSKLLAQHMVSPPFVATTNLGVTGGGSSMNVNDQVLRITALPALLPNSENWTPAITQ